MSRRSFGAFSVVTLVAFVAAACGDSPSNGVVDSGSGTELADDAGSNGEDGASKDAAAKDGRAEIDSSPDVATDDAAVDAGWPDCAAQPSGAVTKTLPQIWSDDATAPAHVWVEDVVVTAISRGACTAGKACQLYVQRATPFASLSEGAHSAIKVFVSAATSSHFTGIQVGDRVDVSGWGWRYTIDGQNEVLVQVNATLPGCMKKIGTATLTPIAVTLSELTHASYEAYGPLLVSVASISGKAQSSPTETFGLYPTAFDGGFDGGAEIVSLSPFFLPGASFAGSQVTPSALNKFSAVTGVFGIFTPAAPDGSTAPTYLELCPRTSADIAK